MSDEVRMLVKIERRPDGKIFKGGVFAIYRVAKPMQSMAMLSGGRGYTQFHLAEVIEETEVEIEPATAELLEAAFAKAQGR